MTTPAISVQCPTCGALPGYACVTPTDDTSPITHQKRRDAAANVTRAANKLARAAK